MESTCKCLLCAAVLCCANVCVAADAGGAPQPPTPGEAFNVLDDIIVSATLTPQAQKDVAGETSVIDAIEIENRQVQDIRDLVRYEPGVSVDADATRFGLGGFSIRGLGGDRVRILVDGIAVPDAFSIGSYSDAGRDVVDLDSVKRVEIVRGAASSLYGSDALGGVVSFVTKDPSDYLADGKGRYAAAKLLYNTANRGSVETGTYAAGDGANGIVLVATHRDASQFSNRGEVDSADRTRTRPNPQDLAGNAVLLKYVHEADGRIDRIALDGDRATTDTDALSSVGPDALTGAVITQLAGDDLRQRLRLSAGQEFTLASALADSLDWNAYVQRSETAQDTLQQNAGSVTSTGAVRNPLQRFRRFDFDQTVYGANATAHKTFATGAARHLFTYGIDLSRTRTAEQRDGLQTDLVTGATTNVIVPDTFPTRDFPISDTTKAAVFAQDEIALADGRLSLIPGLRADYYDLDPRADAKFAQANPGFVVAGLNRTSWSPKFGAIWRFNPVLGAFVQYVHGFRAPPYDDVNFGFTNLAFGYTALPNPKLKPETSNGVEIGLRGDGAAGYFSVSAYENRYRDFIEELAFVGFDPGTGLIQFQSINLSEAKIRGAEARFGLDLGAFTPALGDFGIKGSLAYARGDDETAQVPLADVDPAKAVLGLTWNRGGFGAELAGTFVQAKHRLPPAGDSGEGEGDPALFPAPGYATLDFYSHWQVRDHVKLFLALTNLSDRRYWRWGDVRAIAYAPATIDRYSAPGRAVGIGAKVEF
jgi:hemoglobin/transferrin/lactoferrin receptor protein